MFRPLFRGNLRGMDEPKDDFVPAETPEAVPPEWEAWPGEEVEPDEADLAAIADIEAGRFITHEAMMRWLRSLGTENELPPPECGM
jgi:hypothetical protein